MASMNIQEGPAVEQKLLSIVKGVRYTPLTIPPPL
jgi:hypothetical protein